MQFDVQAANARRHPKVWFVVRPSGEIVSYPLNCRADARVTRDELRKKAATKDVKIMSVDVDHETSTFHR